MRRPSAFFVSTVSLAALAVAAPEAAFAQPPAPQEEAPECETRPTQAERDACLSSEVELESGQAQSDDDAVIVTGSRIRRPGVESNVPVTSVAVDELTDQGSLTLGDALNDLPSLRSTFSSANSQQFIGTTGLSLLDLRGLGTTRTLVLVNGRRHVTGVVGTFRVDVNTIPLQLLERADVVTGGSSAVYGSDALAGVVNFILRRDFDGIRVTGQAGISDRGDRGSYGASLIAGRNFGDGRGNVAFVAEYARTQPVFATARPEQSGAFFGFNGFIQTDNTIGETSAGDNIPDNTFQRGVRYNFISEGGTLTTFCGGSAATQPLACDASGNQIFYEFGADGRLRRAPTPTVDFRTQVPGSSFMIGGGGSTLADYGTYFPQLERFNFNLMARYELAEAFQPFIEAKFARLNVFTESSPSFNNSFCGGLAGLGGIDDSCDRTPGGPNNRGFANTSTGLTIRFDNAFLDPQSAALARSLQVELLRANGSNANPTFFRLNRNNLDLGVRQEDNQRDTYRFVGGIEGTFNEDWRYEISAVYGEFHSIIRSQNNLLVQEFRNAVDAVRNAQGQIVCRINADASTTNDDPRCIPINVFGFNRPSEQARSYFMTAADFTEEATQLDVVAYVNGDTSQFLNLPGGPVRFVVGGEFRREHQERTVDPRVRERQTFLTALSDFRPPDLEVSEVFGELNLPILRDLPFAQQLELQAAVRYSDYNEGAGNTNGALAYNFSAIWAPVRDIRFRVNYSQAVRAPDPISLFQPQSGNFAFLTDPCDRRFITGGPPQRVTNCRSDTPIGRVPPSYQQPSGNRSILNGGNPDLVEETSRSFTAGVILQPRFLPGFSLTVDYYDIEVNSLIATLGGNVILQQCYDAENFPDNQFCNLIGARQPDGQLNANAAVTTGPVNFARLTARGIDFDAAYRRTLANGDRISLRAITTLNLERTNYLDPLNPDAPNRVLSELGDPRVAANFNASYRTGPITLSYSLNFIGPQTIGTFEAQNSYRGICTAAFAASIGCRVGELATLPPQNPDAFPQVYYPSVFYHAARIEFQPVERFTFYVGVDNIGDQLPPFGLTGTGDGSGIFENVGRFFYSGARINF